MNRRTYTIRRTAAVLLSTAVAAGILGAGWTGSAGAAVPQRVPAVTAPPPPSGSGVVVLVVVPEPVGPLSFT